MNITKTGVLINTRDQLGIQPNDNLVPITLNYNINPKYSTIVRDSSSSVTGSSTIYTTPADKDFYLTEAQLGYDKDAVCDAISFVYLTVIQGGAGRKLITIPIRTTTSDFRHIILQFAYPVKLDKNSAITHYVSFTAGTCYRTASIAGFILE
jgi:hypothetical protein